MTAREALVTRVEAHWPLLGWRRWWLWQARPRPGSPRLRKVPVRVVSGGHLVAHAPDDVRAWRPWAAVKRDHLAGLGDGVGFALGDDLLCVDLDNCFTPGGALQEHAGALLDAVNGYAERSPSGGLHLLGRADAASPPISRRDGRVEVLRRGLITVTGDVLPGRSPALASGADLAAVWPQQVMAMPPMLTTPRVEPLVSDIEDLLATAARLRNAHRFLPLWHGDVSAHQSPSEADFALCRHLYFLLGPHQDAIDAAFRSSVLYERRPNNWCRRAYSGPPPLTYGQLTIRRAIACGGPTLMPRRQP